jgi:hypothetical protein
MARLQTPIGKPKVIKPSDIDPAQTCGIVPILTQLKYVGLFLQNKSTYVIRIEISEIGNCIWRAFPLITKRGLEMIMTTLLRKVKLSK